MTQLKWRMVSLYTLSRYAHLRVTQLLENIDLFSIFCLFVFCSLLSHWISYRRILTWYSKFLIFCSFWSCCFHYFHLSASLSSSTNKNGNSIVHNVFFFRNASRTHAHTLFNIPVIFLFSRKRIINFCFCIHFSRYLYWIKIDSARRSMGIVNVADFQVLNFGKRFVFFFLRWCSKRICDCKQRYHQMYISNMQWCNKRMDREWKTNEICLA